MDGVAEDYLDAAAQLDPVIATGWGVPGHETELPEYSPEWLEQVSILRSATLRRLGETDSVDSIDRVTAAALREELEVAEQLRASGADESCLNIISSPVQLVRDVFAMMPSSTVEDWATITRRLAAVPDALAGYKSSLQLASDRGVVSAVRQVAAVAGQARSAGSSSGFFAGMVASAQTVAGEPVPPRLQADLGRAAADASAAYVDLADFLEDELAIQAPVHDAVGIERYTVQSRSFLGSAIDLAETYEWGQHELVRIVDQMTMTADHIYPGASVREAIGLLNNDPSRTLHGTDALREWMQTTSDAAVAALAGTHFDIPESIQRLECRIASTHTGGIYYTRPSEDLTQPGCTWWSVPTGVSSFATWSQLSAVYHEGVPGHHLQIAQTMLSDTLNRWRRIGSWNSGHGEGWALYAENLMAELGFLNDPADYLGMLDSQSLRAARVGTRHRIPLRLSHPEIHRRRSLDIRTSLRIPSHALRARRRITSL